METHHAALKHPKGKSISPKKKIALKVYEYFHSKNLDLSIASGVTMTAKATGLSE